MDLDVDYEIEFEAERQFGFDQDMYDFDLSGVTVTIKSFRLVGQPSIRPVRLKVVDTIDKTNCTGVQQTENFPAYSEQHTESFSVTFGSKVSWGNVVTGSLAIPGGLTVGATRSLGVDLTASATHSVSNTKTVSQAGSPVVIPPCQRVRATREIWMTEVSGQVVAMVNIKGNVSYSVNIPMWPDPEYDMDLDFDVPITGTFSGVMGHAIRGGYQASPAMGCNPPCRVQTANAARLQTGRPRVALASAAGLGLDFRSKVALSGVQGARLDEPFGFEENPERPLIVSVAMIPDVPGFDTVVGKASMKLPLAGIEGVTKLNIPVTCHVPGELLGIEAETVPVTVVQPVKVALFPA
ncbi:ETX/MTX2 family pore-forming toxin [Tropicibacter sp. S64]|uniref:ETX/MTX2 family pore-forming toxin n=1 Tax=Tropicibacter sp. S64 TaxID=3415122 RepID=UPI003C7D64C5